ncbi:MAG: hypothetical protein JW797_06350 [Bradymonadales bacterium]|nr:hypothetical protein [Bradymonadales bacterium]
MKGFRLLLLAVPIWLLCTGCPTSEDEDEPRDVAQDAGMDRTADRTPDPTIDPTIDPVTEPTVDLTPDPTIDPVTDPVVEPRPDVTVDPTTDPTNDTVFPACITGLGVDGEKEASWDAEYNVMGYYWIDVATAEGWSKGLSVEIWTEYGGPTEGDITYTITEDDTGYDTCGVCIVAYTRDKDYMPVAGGIVHISQLNTGDGVIGSTFAANINLTMQEVTIDWEETGATTVVPEGCSGPFQYSFSETVVEY